MKTISLLYLIKVLLRTSPPLASKIMHFVRPEIGLDCLYGLLYTNRLFALPTSLI